MSVIRMSRTHKLDELEARKLADEVVNDLSNEFGVKHHWEGDTVKFKGAGAKGRMSLTPGVVDLKMELSFLLSPLKTKIENSIKRRLDALFL